MPIYSNPPWGDIPSAQRVDRYDYASSPLYPARKRLLTHSTTGLTPEVLNSDVFGRSQYGRWLLSGDPHLEQAGTIEGHGDRIIRFPDGSYGRYGRAHEIQLGMGAGEHPGEASGSAYDRWVAQLTRGETFDYNGPTVFGGFLSQESAPGGFLSPANTSNETARGVREIFNQGRQQRSAIASSLASTGLNERYAKGAIAQAGQATTEQATEYLSGASFASGERRFQATLDFLNQAAQATLASKMEKENQRRAEEEAKRRRKGDLAGGVLGAVGGAVGGYLGGPAGAAAGYGAGSALGHGIY